MKTLIASLIIGLSTPTFASVPQSAQKTVIVKKVKLFRSHPFRFTSIRLLKTDPLTTVDDEDVLPQRRYRWQPDRLEVDISDHAKFRLMLARMLAMKKYHEVWG